MINLNNFGSKFKLKKRDSNVEPLSEYTMFIEAISKLDKCWDRSNRLYEEYKLNVLEYEEDYFQIIENLITMKYGEWKSEIILWYIFGRKGSEDEVYPLMMQVKGEEKVEVILNTPSELWYFLEKLDKHKQEEEEK
jgi:hypothetical protein